MSGTKVMGRAFLALAVSGLLAPSFAVAGVGGVAAPEPPTVATASCAGTPAGVCPRGAQLQITGAGLAATRTVLFVGTRSPRDDRRVTPVKNGDEALSVVVPAGAHSGPVQLATSAGDRIAAMRRMIIRGKSTAPAAPLPTTGSSGDGPALPAGKVFLDGPPATFRYTLSPATAGAHVELYRVGEVPALQSWVATTDATGTGQVQWNGKLGGKAAPVGRYGFRVTGAQASTASAASTDTGEFDLLDHIFPIRGKHDLGQSGVNGFGGGRGHQGQDMFAACGTPLVAARGGKVVKATFQSRAGNYVVITGDDGQSNAYMHMKDPALVHQGDRVQTGQAIGLVGESGRASGCHLHFELWTAPGWYTGGKAVDPLPSLTAWDAQT
jgi:murein DD-endopeptidase MepM/ murein hydrolase activator NlpD